MKKEKIDKIKDCIYIPSIDAKDLYLADLLRNRKQDQTGCRLTTKSGEMNYRRFNCSLDFSLEREKIREIAKDIYGKKETFSFSYHGKEYSDKIISVTFQYNCKEFNQIKKDTYVMAGYSLDELEFHDNLAFDGEKIVGVIVGAPIREKTCPELPKGFLCNQNTEGVPIYTAANITVTHTKKQLRDELYTKGFYCNGRRYVRFMRTSGSARVGKCLFIDERLYPRLHEWELCGLPIAENDSVDLAALESYLSLPASSAIDILSIDPKSILIIPDCESRFKEDSVIVEMDEQKRLVSSEGPAEISNSIFDGQSLIDPSIMGDYSRYGMILLRNRFFKSCCFNTNIQQWFREQKITELSQLHKDSLTLAQKIEDIKLITTPNSIKYTKFASLTQWLNQIDSVFSIIKHEKKTHFFDGRMVQTHYQLLNTLQLTPDEMHRLLAPSLHYVNLLNTDNDVLRYHTRCCVLDSLETEPGADIWKSKHDVTYAMMHLSKNFYRTKYFYDFKKETCKSYLNNLKKGHLLIDGNYSVLFGNPYEMLLHSIGKFDAASGISSLPPGHVHTTRYPYGRKILGCRSPHISTSNILISTNIQHSLIDRYFNLTDEIICVNAINENLLERLSGADYDSDQMIVSDNELLIHAALKNYEVFKVPANRVAAKKSKRFYTDPDKSDLDYRTSENKIGEIVNLSQELNTLMWNTVNEAGLELKDSYEIIRELYHDICILNVLSCIEIDKAKKEFDISSIKEIKKIKEKWGRYSKDGRTVKPAFLGFIAQTKGYRNPQQKKYDYHKTSMDYLLKELSSYRSTKTTVGKLLPLSECFCFADFNPCSVNRKQTARIVKMCEDTASAVHAVWSKDYYSPEEKYQMTQQYKDDLALELQKMKLNRHTLYTLITFTDKKKYAHIAKLLFFVLFNYKHHSMTELISELEPPASYIRESADGEISLYGIKFKRYGGTAIE